MIHDREIAISRRAVLRVAAIGGAGMLVLQPTAAFGATSSSGIEKRSGAVDAYLAATPIGGFTDLEGIHAEYREAAAKFPFDLPSGWAFPPESSLQNTVTSQTTPASKVMWERGNGIAEVYMFWLCAVATAAYEAYVRDDRAGVESLLDTLEAGFSSDVRRAVLEDPADGFLKVDVAEARIGDFTSLKEVASA